MTKLYIVEYSTKCKRGSRRYRKLVESEDIESYINQHFLLGYSYARGAKMLSRQQRLGMLVLESMRKLMADFTGTDIRSPCLNMN